MGGRLLLSRGRELGRAPATGREPDGDRTRGRRLIIDFAAINRAALPVLLPLLRRWLSKAQFALVVGIGRAAARSQVLEALGSGVRSRVRRQPR